MFPMTRGLMVAALVLMVSVQESAQAEYQVGRAIDDDVPPMPEFSRRDAVRN
jgi:hypothetical protein